MQPLKHGVGTMLKDDEQTASHLPGKGDQGLDVQDLHVGYGKRDILRGASLIVRPARTAVLLGANGSGKSTLLRAIVGLVCASKGEIRLDGESLTGLEPHVVSRLGAAYLPQGGRVFANLSVHENIEIVGGHKDSTVLGHDLVRQDSDVSSRRSGLLSGGERQLLALEMTLCQSARVFLLDEPCAGLSPDLVPQVVEKILERSIELEAAVLVIEQSAATARLFSSECLELRNGQINATRARSMPAATRSQP